MNPIRELPDRWRAEADAYERDGALVRGDRLLRRMSAELDVAFRAWELEALTLQRAAEESGYTYSAIEKMVRRGELTNVGKLGAPRVQRGDLPRKASHASRPTRSSGEPDVAAEILSARSEATA